MTQINPYIDPTSLRFRFRKRRFPAVAALIDEAIAKRGFCSVLDVGGTETYWLIGKDFLDARAGKLKITLLNLKTMPVSNAALFEGVGGDACNLAQFADMSFDLVHSNSVIEHVGCWASMSRMAGEVRRLAPRYYVQTPHFWFPIEPHYESLMFHWLPQNVQARRLTRRAHGFVGRMTDLDAAMRHVQHTVLMDKRQFAHLFPDAQFPHEKFCGLTKSLIAARSARDLPA